MKKTLAALVIASVLGAPSLTYAATDAEYQALWDYNVALEQYIASLTTLVAQLQDELIALKAEKKAKKLNKKSARTTKKSANATARMSEMEIYKLVYEQDDETIYLRTSLEGTPAIEGYSLEVVDSKEFDSKSCVGSGKNKKCGGFMVRLKATPELAPGTYTLTIGGASDTFKVN